MDFGILIGFIEFLIEVFDADVFIKGVTNRLDATLFKAFDRSSFIGEVGFLFTNAEDRQGRCDAFFFEVGNDRPVSLHDG